jgi:isopentenyl-diphosphate delta-isomerase
MTIRFNKLPPPSGCQSAGRTMEEQIIRVDANDKEIGFIGKSKAHEGNGILHRAFSIVIVNSKREMLIQKRSAGKPLWGSYWANACCSHQRKGEKLEDSVHRRLIEEVGFDCKLREVFSFLYAARFEDKGSENEIDHVFIGTHDGEVTPNPDEIDEAKWISIDALLKDIEENPGGYAPWFRILTSKMKQKNLLQTGR